LAADMGFLKLQDKHNLSCNWVIFCHNKWVEINCCFIMTIFVNVGLHDSGTRKKNILVSGRPEQKCPVNAMLLLK
jgi:hypothetical protein